MKNKFKEEEQLSNINLVRWKIIYLSASSNNRYNTEQ